MTDTVRYKVAIVGASETTGMGDIPGMSSLMLAADATMNAIKDCGIDKNKIDGVFSTHNPTQLAHYLGITPTCIDGTSIGGTSFLLHVRHAAAALALGYCNYALVTMGESGYTRGDMIGIPRAPIGGGRGGPGMQMGGFGPNNSISGQFEAPYGPVGPTSLFGMGVLRYMKETGLTHEQLASVAVAQSKWVKDNPRALTPARGDGRGRAREPDDLLPVPRARVLPGHGRRRRPDPDDGRPGQGLPDQAGLHSRHRRVGGDADGEPDEGLHQLAGLSRVQQEGDGRGAGQALRHRPHHDLRRLRAPADLRPGRRRLLQARRGGAVHRGGPHVARRQAAGQYDRRRACATRTPACTACT